MDRFKTTPIYRLLSAAGAIFLLSTTAHEGQAGTRLLPPPPPRHSQNEGVTDNSYWGQEPEKPYANSEDEDTARNSRERFSALEDEEGREINFNTQRRRPSRAPAGLQVKGRPLPPEQRPSVETPTRQHAEVPATEVARQEERTERFVTDLNDPVERRKGVQEVAIIASDLGFFPKTIFVSRDIPVRLFVTGASKQSLCLMLDTFNVRKQVKASKIEEITFVPSQPGTYRFYCPINNGEGTLVVKELSTNLAATE